MVMIQTPVATITLVEGRPLDLMALEQVLPRYGYMRAEAGPIQWFLPDSGHVPYTESGLTFAEDGCAIKLYSRSARNIANVNFVGAQAGWTSCACYAADAAIEQLVLEAFKHVRPVRLQIAGEAPLELAAGVAWAKDAAPPTSADLMALGCQIADELAHVSRRLAELTAALEQSQRVLAGNTKTELDVAFARQVESLAGLSCIRETPVARLLKAQGYEVALSVVRTS